MNNKFDIALLGMRAKLAEHLIYYGYQPQAPISLKNVPTSPAARAARVGAVIMAAGLLAEEEARQIAWAAKDGKDFWPDLAALRSVTDIDLMTLLVRSDKPIASLDRDEIDMLAASARDAARSWAASHLGDALHEADRAYKEAAKDA